MAKNLLALARAIFGLLRCNTGVFCLKTWFVWRRIDNRPPDFQTGWRVAKSLKWLLQGRGYVANRFRQNWCQFAMSKLMAEYRNNELGVFPEIAVFGENLLEKVFQRGAPPIIVLCPHRRCDAVAAVLKKYDPNLVCVSKSRRAANAANHYGHQGELDIVVTGAYTLMESRAKLKAGQALKADPDFTERRPGWLYQDIFVSVGLFRLAIVCRANVLFAISQVLENGVIQVTFEMPDVVIAKSTPNELAELFVNFSVVYEPALVGMKVEKKNSKILYPKKRLYDFCVAEF